MGFSSIPRILAWVAISSSKEHIHFKRGEAGRKQGLTAKLKLMTIRGKLKNLSRDFSPPASGDYLLFS